MWNTHVDFSQMNLPGNSKHDRLCTRFSLPRDLPPPKAQIVYNGGSSNIANKNRQLVVGPAVCTSPHRSSLKIPLKLPLKNSLKMPLLMVGMMVCHEGGQVAKTTGKRPTNHLIKVNNKFSKYQLKNPERFKAGLPTNKEELRPTNKRKNFAILAQLT